MDKIQQPIRCPPTPAPPNSITCGCVWSHEELKMVAHAGPGLGQPLRMGPSKKEYPLHFCRKNCLLISFITDNLANQISGPCPSVRCPGVMMLVHLSQCVGDGSL